MDLHVLILLLFFSVHAIGLMQVLKMSVTAQRMACFFTGSPGTILPVYLSIMAIFKNEAEYLAEWIEYHLLVGVERFWLIDNGSESNNTVVLNPYIASDIVRLSTITGRGRQVIAYNLVIQRLRNASFWVAVIDIDEFLVPVNSHCIPQFLTSFEGKDALEVNWVIYGWNRKNRKGNGLVIERFPYHSDWKVRSNRFVKLIVQPRKVKFLHVHTGVFQSGRSDNLCGFNTRFSMFQRPPCHKILRINHYWSKSKEEWVRKLIRGRGSDTQVYPISLVNTVKDTVMNDTIMDWYIPRVKANLVGKGTYPPCHVAINLLHAQEKQAAYELKNRTRKFSWIVSLSSEQSQAKKGDLPEEELRNASIGIKPVYLFILGAILVIVTISDAQLF
jgi:hypothetical protein